MTGASQQRETPTRLSAGGPVERLLSGQAAHRYVLTLDSNQFVEFRIDQRGVDAVVTLFGPDARELSEVNEISGGVGTERVYLLAEKDGEYVVEVRASNPRAPEGRYAVGIHDRRPAVAADRLRIEAQRLHAEAVGLGKAGNRDSFRRSVDVFEAALARWRETGDRWKEAQTLSRLASAWDDLSEYRKAIELNEQALAIRNALGERQLAAINLNNLATAQYYLGDFAAALDAYQRTLPIRRETGDRDGEAWSLGNIAITYQSMGNAVKALEIYPEAIALWRAVGDTRGEALGLHNAGAAHALVGEFQAALDFSNRALALRRAAGDRAGEAQTLSMIGNHYFALDDFRSALDVQQQALPLRRAAGDRRGEAYTLRNIGQAYQGLSDPQQAATHFEAALALFRAIGDKDGEPSALVGLAAAAEATGDKLRAVDLYTQALALYRATGSRRLEAEARSERAELLRTQGRTAEAAAELTAAAAVFGEIRHPADEAGALVRLARIDRDTGRLAEAKVHVETALNRIESLRATVLRSDLRASYLSGKQNAFELHVDVLMALERQNPTGGYAALALEGHERARARSLLETLAEAHADVRQTLTPALRDRQQKIERELNARANDFTRLTAGKPEGEAVAPAEAALKSALRDQEELDAELRATHPQYAELTQARPLAAEAIQRLLDPGTVLLEYALGRDRSYVWAVTPTTLSVHELPARPQIEKAAHRAYEALTNSRLARRRVETRLAIDALSRMLLQPVAQDISGNRLVIVADGALQYIPFAALTDPSATSRDEAGPIPLVATREIVAVPSASVLDALRRTETRIPTDRRVAVLADPVLQATDVRVARAAGPSAATPGHASADLVRSAAEVGLSNGFLRLRFTRQEALAIGRFAGKEGSLTALDFDASRSTAVDPDLGRYRIVHFATHALANSEHPELSGIVLSLVGRHGEPLDGFLRLHDIYNLRLGADLVVLSGCQTALGQDVRGEGLVGLTRGFMYAGAPRVVASLWNVSDRATSELMTRFYRGMLQDGLTPAAALRRAQVDMWKDPTWSAPFYWAGFTLQGDWRPATPPR